MFGNTEEVITHKYPGAKDDSLNVSRMFIFIIGLSCFCFHLSRPQPAYFVCILTFLFFLFFFFFFFLSSLLSALSDFKFRVGPGQRWNQENSERRAARRERKSRSRQVQNVAPDPTGQHEAAHRRVRVHVRTLLGYLLPNFSPRSGCSVLFCFFPTDNRCRCFRYQQSGEILLSNFAKVSSHISTEKVWISP